MNRRSFIFSSAFLTVGALESFAIVNSKSSFEIYFNTFVDGVGGYALPQFLTVQNELQILVDKHSKSLIKTGYKPFSSEVFFCDKDRTVFVPYALRVDNKDIDWLVLFFSKDKEGNWQYVKTYSGFQLEIFAELIRQHGKNTSSEELSDLLLPDIRTNGSHSHDMLYTRSAQIQFQVRINDNKTLLDYRIIKNEEVLVVADSLQSNLMSSKYFV